MRPVQHNPHIRSSPRYFGNVLPKNGKAAFCRSAAARFGPLLAAAGALLLPLPGQLWAYDYSWNTTTGNWSDGADWTSIGPSGVPGDGSYATISQPGAVVNFDYTYNDTTALGELYLSAGTGDVTIDQSLASSAMWVYYSNGTTVDENQEIIQGNARSAYYAFYVQTGGTNFTDGIYLYANGYYFLDQNAGNSGTLVTGLESIGSGAYLAQGGGTNMASNLDVSGKFVLGYAGSNPNAAGILEGYTTTSAQDGTIEDVAGGTFLQLEQGFFPSVNDAASLIISGTNATYQLSGGQLNLGDWQTSGSAKTLVPGSITDSAAFLQEGGNNRGCPWWIKRHIYSELFRYFHLCRRGIQCQTDQPRHLFTFKHQLF